MLDVKRFREDFDGVKAALAKRHDALPIYLMKKDVL